MKKIDVKKVIFAFVLPMVIGLTFTGCSEANSDEIVLEEQDVSEVVMSSEIDEASAALEDFIIEVYEDQEDAEFRGVTSSRTTMPDCVTVTVVFQQGFRQITVDFGTEGCMVRGHLFKGVIVFTYERDPAAQEISLGYVLQDFYFDNKNIIGSNSILKQLSNDNGNPQFTHTLDLTVVWPNGAEASRSGLKIREWVEGHGSGVFSDNVFEVTGHWVSVFRNGNTHSYEVLIPLRREIICYYFVNGSVNVQRTNFGGVFDYGEGECDNQATFTHNNGTVREITLN